MKEEMELIKWPLSKCLFLQGREYLYKLPRGRRLSSQEKEEGVKAFEVWPMQVPFSFHTKTKCNLLGLNIFCFSLVFIKTNEFVILCRRNQLLQQSWIYNLDDPQPKHVTSSQYLSFHVDRNLWPRNQSNFIVTEVHAHLGNKTATRTCVFHLYVTS
jgi:hypothetical protein